jgi:hypothetical protein
MFAGGFGRQLFFRQYETSWSIKNSTADSAIDPIRISRGGEIPFIHRASGRHATCHRIQVHHPMRLTTQEECEETS